MAEPLRVTFASWCRATRIDLDITQRELADAVGISRSLVSAYESGQVVPDLDMVDRIGAAMGVDLRLVSRPPVILGPTGERDLVHARCSGHAHRRMIGAGFEMMREVELVDGRAHGWIDLIAFDRRTGRLLIIEIKTSLDDVGAIERQVAWYERLALGAVRDRAWDVRSVQTWLLILATDEADAAIGRQRDVLDAAFPVRAMVMRAIVDGATDAPSGRGLALIDPARRRRDRLLPSRLDGRRTAAPYQDRADARRRLGGPARPPTEPSLRG